MKTQADPHVADFSPPPEEHRSRLAQWIFAGHTPGSAAHEHVPHQEPWYKVMWLTGVDYFSSLAYQAGIALIAAGLLAPIATAILVLVTLAFAVPVYREVSRRSYAGLGSIAMLEHILPGWWSKLFVLVLLGFASTDFVITMTLSAADSAKHAVENPLLKPYLGHLHMAITIGLLVLLALVFLRGFGEAIRLAVAVAVPYVLLNAVVIARCSLEVLRHPELLRNWHAAIAGKGETWPQILLAAVIVFPQLALGLSGFETGVAVMPLVRGDADEEERRSRSSRQNSEHWQAAGDGGRADERVFAELQRRYHSAHSARRLSSRTGQRTRLGLPRSSLSGKRIRYAVRRQHHPDPVVRRRICHGWTAATDTAISAATRHGAAVGRTGAAACAGAVRD